jgi:hypothetical protein
LIHCTPENKKSKVKSIWQTQPGNFIRILIERKNWNWNTNSKFWVLTSIYLKKSLKIT